MSGPRVAWTADIPDVSWDGTGGSEDYYPSGGGVVLDASVVVTPGRLVPRGGSTCAREVRQGLRGRNRWTSVSCMEAG